MCFYGTLMEWLYQLYGLPISIEVSPNDNRTELQWQPKWISNGTSMQLQQNFKSPLIEFHGNRMRFQWKFYGNSLNISSGFCYIYWFLEHLSSIFWHLSWSMFIKPFPSYLHGFGCGIKPIGWYSINFKDIKDTSDNVIKRLS